MPVSRPLETEAVELWLRQCLREQHAAIMREPLPEGLVRMLQDETAQAR